MPTGRQTFTRRRISPPPAPRVQPNVLQGQPSVVNRPGLPGNVQDITEFAPQPFDPTAFTSKAGLKTGFKDTSTAAVEKGTKIPTGTKTIIPTRTKTISTTGDENVPPSLPPSPPPLPLTTDVNTALEILNEPPPVEFNDLGSPQTIGTEFVTDENGAIVGQRTIVARYLDAQGSPITDPKILSQIQTWQRRQNNAKLVVQQFGGVGEAPETPEQTVAIQGFLDALGVRMQDIDDQQTGLQTKLGNLEISVSNAIRLGDVMLAAQHRSEQRKLEREQLELDRQRMFISFLGVLGSNPALARGLQNTPMLQDFAKIMSVNLQDLFTPSPGGIAGRPQRVVR